MTNEDVMQLVYRRSDHIRCEIQANGKVVVMEAQNHPIQKFFRRLGFKIPPYSRVELDEYASAAFLLVDGVRNVEVIGAKMKERFGEASEPLYERLLLFLHHIDQNCHYIELVKADNK